MERSAKRETAASDDVSTAEKRLKNEAEEVSYVDATCSEIVQPPSPLSGDVIKMFIQGDHSEFDEILS